MPNSVFEQIKFLGDQLEEGEIENVLLLLSSVKAFLPHLVPLMLDERLRVRAGVYTLLHELDHHKIEGLKEIAPLFLPLLQDVDTRVRGEALSVLEIIGTAQELTHITPFLTDENFQLRELAEDATTEIQSRLGY
ncbi:MAG: hypothetical protein QNL04_08280 [SAR324 cluster bacterium]|nr:hypothetical protein [SAR324 cluster bacterium]